MPSRPEFGIGEFGIGLFGIGEFGIGLFGIGEFGIGAEPTAEFGIGLFGIGENANEPSSAGGTELSGTFAAPAGTDGSSEVSFRPVERARRRHRDAGGELGGAAVRVRRGRGDRLVAVQIGDVGAGQRGA